MAYGENMIDIMVCFTSKEALREEESWDPERFGLTLIDPHLERRGEESRVI